MATPETWENTTPIYGIRYPKPSAPAQFLPTMFEHTGLDVEAALHTASIPPVTPAPVMVAATAGARDAYWGVPANETERLALQARGATTIRTDLGSTERYFATYNASSNTVGRTPAGWYDVAAPIKGVFTYGALYKASATFGGCNIERLPGSKRVHMFGVITVAQAVSFNAGTEYTLGTIPAGFRPPAGGEVFRPFALSPLGIQDGWMAARANGNLSFAAGVAYNAPGADGYSLGFDFWFDAA